MCQSSTSTQQTGLPGWTVFPHINLNKNDHRQTLKHLVFGKSKCCKLGGWIQGFLLLGTVFISFCLSIFIFRSSSSSSSFFGSFPLLQICCISGLPFCSFRPWLYQKKKKKRGGKKGHEEHMLITKENKTKTDCSFVSIRAPNTYMMTKHQAAVWNCILSCIITIDRLHLFGLPALLLLVLLFIYFFRSLSRDKRKRHPERNGAGMNHRAWWVDWQQHRTHTHTHTHTHILFTSSTQWSTAINPVHIHTNTTITELVDGTSCDVSLFAIHH